MFVDEEGIATSAKWWTAARALISRGACRHWPLAGRLNQATTLNALICKAPASAKKHDVREFRP
jgi:hypothetical protein